MAGLWLGCVEVCKTEARPRMKENTERSTSSAQMTSIHRLCAHRGLGKDRDRQDNLGNTADTW